MPRLKEMAGNWVALGRVILIAPLQFAFRNVSSCPVRGRTARSFGIHDSGYAARVCVFRFAGFPRPRHRIAQVEAFDGIGEIAHEIAAAKFAIGEDLETEFLLLREHAQYVPVLDRFERRRIRPFCAACFQ